MTTGMHETVVEQGVSADMTRAVERAQRMFAELDAALDAVGSPRRPQRRTDRAPAMRPTPPIFDPAALSY